MSYNENVLFEFFETIIKDSQLFKIKSQIDKKIKELDKKNLKEDKRKQKEEELKKLKEELFIQREKSKKEEIRDWLEKRANNAISLNENKKETSISLATHPTKLTHSSISGATNIYFKKNSCVNNYLSTSSIEDKKLDIGHPDNKLAPVGKLLIFLYNKNIVKEIPTVNDFNVLKPFTKDNAQFKKWIKGFSLYFHVNTLATHSLAKQMYFPVDDGYHMISPFVASSLEQALFEKIQYSKYKETKKIRDQKKAGKFHKEMRVYYPNLAILMVTVSQHGNASPLNGKRGGKRYLFSSAPPPQWKSTLRPPLYQTSLFYGEYERRVWRKVKSLQAYFLELENEKSNKRIRDNIKRSINWIVDTLFDYVAEIQNMRESRGWSAEDGKLKVSHRLWLDPYRDDEAFQSDRNSGLWQDEVCLDFGIWLNKKLEHKKMLFEKRDSTRWAKLLKGRLREFERDLEVLR